MSGLLTAPIPTGPLIHPSSMNPSRTENLARENERTEEMEKEEEERSFCSTHRFFACDVSKSNVARQNIRGPMMKEYV